jgi:GNAT superfamily N-acetyltransferase
MTLKAFKTELPEILALRNLFLQENNFQLRYNACHERGWTDSYMLTLQGERIGYGAVRGQEKHSDRDTIFEFYLLPSYRDIISLGFDELLRCSKASWIECQSNDKILTPLLFEFGQNINSPVILFEDNIKTTMRLEHLVFRKRKQGDLMFKHQVEPMGDYVLARGDEILATGGFLLHYNKPFADLYMEVREDWRRQGLGSLLIQEVKRECYLAGRVPAARCNMENMASRATLLKGGLRIAGYMLLGSVK